MIQQQKIQSLNQYCDFSAITSISPMRNASYYKSYSCVLFSKISGNLGQEIKNLGRTLFKDVLLLHRIDSIVLATLLGRELESLQDEEDNCRTQL